jgi:hypothetical protein
MHGAGTFFWPDGKSFKGEYRHDRKHGAGVFTWPDGKKLSGVWEDGE